MHALVMCPLVQRVTSLVVDFLATLTLRYFTRWHCTQLLFG